MAIGRLRSLISITPSWTWNVSTARVTVWGRNVRQVTKSVDPKGLAIWPLPELHGRLSGYLYEIQDTFLHPALGQTPREAFRIGMASGGARIHRMVAYNEEFMILTLPATAKGTAKVMVSRGVKINHIYYWCDAFRQKDRTGWRLPRALRVNPRRHRRSADCPGR